MKLLKNIFLIMILSMYGMAAYADDLDDITIQVIDSDDNSIEDVDNNLELPDDDHDEDKHDEDKHEDRDHDGKDDAHDEHDDHEDEHEDEHEDHEDEHEDENESEDDSQSHS